MVCAFIIIFSLIAGVFNTKPAKAAAGINQQLNYQGRLLDSAGAVVPDGTYNMEFKIYDGGNGCVPGGSAPCGGTLDWTETWTGANKITVINGFFSTQLGAVNPFAGSVDWNNDTLWLSVNIGGTGAPSWDGEMTPFRRLSAVPYAFNSQQLGGIAASGFVQLAPNTVQADASTNNSIFLNKTGGSGNILQLQKAGADVLTLGNTGALALQNTANSTTALTVKNAAGSQTTLAVDTTNNRVGIGAGSPTNTLTVSGTANVTGHMAVGANANVNATSDILYPSLSYNSTLNIAEIKTDLTSTDVVDGITNHMLLSPTANTTAAVTTLNNEVFTDGAVSFDYNQDIFGIDNVVNHQGSGDITTNANGAFNTVINSGSGGISFAYGSQSFVNNSGTGSLGFGIGARNWAINNGAGSTANFLYGSINSGENNTSTTVPFVFGATGEAKNTIDGSITNADGLYSVIDNSNASGIITNAKNIETTTDNAGDITNLYGILVNTPTNTGTVTNNYGLNIEDQSGVGSSNSYNLYSDGANSKNYFAGKVGIGATTPAVKLQINDGVNSEYVRFNDSTDYTGLFIVNADPNGSVTGSKGSIAMDYTNGAAYINTNDSTGWSQIATTGSTCAISFCQGGNSFAATAVLGTNDNNDLEIETNGSTKMTVKTTGEVGIGTTTPTSTLTVAGDIRGTGHTALGPNGSIDSCDGIPILVTCSTILDVQETFTHTSSVSPVGSITGVTLDPASTPGYGLSVGGGFSIDVASGNSTNINAEALSTLGIVTHNGTGTLTTAEGIGGIVLNASTGTINTASAIIGAVSALSGSTITDAYGIRVEINNTGTITNGYGLYIQDVGATNDYGVYQVGADDINYFAGNTGIGTSTPANMLTVNGSANVTEHAAIGANANVDATSDIIYPASSFNTTANIQEIKSALSVDYVENVTSHMLLTPSADVTAEVRGIDNITGLTSANNYNGNTYGIYNALVNTSTGTVASASGTINLFENTSTGTVSFASGAENEAFNAAGGSVPVMWGSRSWGFNTGTGSTTNSLYGSINIAENGNATTIATGKGATGEIKNIGTGGFTDGADFYAWTQNLSTGTITNMRGLQVVTNNNGTITNNRGIEIDTPTNAGIIGNNYGVYIQDQSGVATGDNFNLYSVGASSTNYFQGKVGINTTSPAEKLEVNGNALVDGHSATGAGNSINDVTLLHPGQTGWVVDDNAETVSTVTGYDRVFGTTGNILVNPTSISGTHFIGGVEGAVAITGGADYSSSFVAGVRGAADYIGTGNVSTLRGGDFGTTYAPASGTPTASELNGVNAFSASTAGNVLSQSALTATLYTLATANVTNTYGLDVAMQNAATIANQYGIRIGTPTNTGTITNQYGVYVAAQNGIGSSASYNVYSAGASSTNYFQGSVGIGAATPAVKLQIGDGVNSEYVRFSDGTDTSGLFLVNANPNGSVTGARGSIAMDYTNGAGYINNDDLTSWSQILTTTTSCSSSTTIFCQNGNSFGSNGVLGTNDAYALQFETNNTTRATLDTAGRFGLGTTTPEFKLDLNNDGSIIARGTYGSGDTLTTTGAGTRLIWYSQKSAFRAGTVTGSAWDNANIGPYSFSGGYDNLVNGDGATGFGYTNTVSGSQAFAVGYLNTSSNLRTVALGYNNTASGQYSVAIGDGNIANNVGGSHTVAIGYGNISNGDYSVAIGNQNNSTGSSSLAVGVATNSTGVASLSSGYLSTASGYISTAFGQNSLASSSYATAMGLNTQATGYASLASGESSVASGSRATALVQSTASGDYAFSTNVATASGQYSMALNSSTASGYESLAGGESSQAYGVRSIAFGHSTKANQTAGQGGFSWGESTIADNNYATAFGRNTSATGDSATASGNGSTASGDYSVATNGSHATGALAFSMNGSTASGYESLAGGESSQAYGVRSIAFGYSTKANQTAGQGGFSWGELTIADNNYATAFGRSTSATGDSATASGNGSVASGGYSFAANSSSASNDGAFSINAGTASGTYAFAGGENSNVASGRTAVVFGNNNLASTQGAFAWGHATQAITNNWTTAWGENSIASGYAATASGSSVASGDYAFSINNSTASGLYSFSAGENNTHAYGRDSIAFGYNTKANQTAGQGGFSWGASTIADNYYATAFGRSTSATGDSATASGNGSVASGGYSFASNASVASGTQAFSINNGTASGTNSFAGGQSGTTASGQGSIAFGYNTAASGSYSTTLGVNTLASTQGSVAWGNGAQATTNTYATASGNGSTATGQYSFASNASVASGTQAFSINNGTASGTNSFAGGESGTTASGQDSIAFGNNVVASNSQTVAFGRNTTASGTEATAIGRDITVSGTNSVGIGLASGVGTVSQNNTLAILGGSVGIDTTAPAYKLEVTDTTTTNVANFNGSGSTTCTVVTGSGWSCSSDENLKTNILSINGGLDKILQLRGVTFNWKVDPEGTQVDGFLAQEVQKVFPELVTTDKNGNLSLDKNGLLPYIVSAIQEQNTKVGNLETRVSNLELAQNQWNGGIVANNTEFQGQATFDALVTMAGNSVFTGSATFNGTTTINGRLVLNDDIRGKNIAIDQAAITKTITLGAAQPDANYSVMCTPSWNTTCFVTNKTTTTFDLNFGTAAGPSSTVDWLIVR